MLKRIAVALGMVAVMGGFVDVANARTPSASEAENKKSTIDGLIQSEMLARGIPGLQLTIVQRGKIVLTGAYGKANIETADPVTEQTVFPINSISKAFAGVAAMQLVAAGKLDLDAPLATYLDALPASWRGITVRQILTHVSGLPEIVDDNLRLIDGAPDAAWAKVQELPVRFPAGSRFDYTQTNYVALGRIIEKVTGKPFSDFVRDRQLDIVGMRSTDFAGSAAAGPRVASLYTHLTLLTKGTETVGVERSKTPFARHEPWTESLLPAGGIRATATDLANWTIALQKLKLMDKHHLRQLWTPQPLNDGTYRGFDATINGYALGWPIIRRPAHPAVTPTGGARAAIFIYPEDDLTVIVLTNLMGASPQKFIDKIAATYIPGLIVEN